MRQSLEDLVRDATLFSIGAAIALAWTLVGLAGAISYAVVGFVEKNQPDQTGLDLFQQELAVHVGDHVLNLASVLNQLIAFAIVLGVVVFAARRRAASAGTRT